MLYTMMNRNKKILDFEYNSEYNAFLGIVKRYDLTYAPLTFITHQENLEKEFYRWLQDRKIPPLRDNLKYLLESLKQRETTETMISGYGLSLSDQYWFKPNCEEVDWKTINYFDNHYNSYQFMEATFGYQLDSNSQYDDSKTNYTPNMSTNGQLSKCWIKQNEQNLLFKGANTIYRFEPICEVIASQLCSILEVPYVPYKCTMLEGKKSTTLVSVCPTMIQSHQEFIPAYQILNESLDKKTNTPQDYYLYLDILNKHHVPHAKEYLQKMVMLDFILANEDRHLGNFGVIRNLDTMQWESICPIFDTGRGLNTNVSSDYWDDEVVDMKFFSSDFITSDIVKDYFDLSIEHNQIDKMLKVVDMFEKLLIRYQGCLTLTMDDIHCLIHTFKKRIHLFEQIMLEKKLLL
ncbi:MAG: hypothetical protein RR630_03835 [Coprobacillus sp.]